LIDGQVEVLTYLSHGVARRLVFRRIGRGRVQLADGSITTATAFAANLRKWLAIRPARIES
jgi:hypothetical protein